jgi:hypothetical protein
MKGLSGRMSMQMYGHHYHFIRTKLKTEKNITRVVNKKLNGFVIFVVLY